MQRVITGAGESRHCAGPPWLISTQESICFSSRVKARESSRLGRRSHLLLMGESALLICLVLHLLGSHSPTLESSCPTLSESLQDLWLYFSSALGDKPNREMGHYTDSSELPQCGSHQEYVDLVFMHGPSPRGIVFVFATLTQTREGWCSLYGAGI